MKKAIYIITVVVLLFIINGLARSTYDLWQKQDLVADAERTLELEKIKNQKLKASLSYVETREFIETQARDKLFLGKPQEQKVIIPKDLIGEKKKEAKKDTKENWQKWLDLFL